MDTDTRDTWGERGRTTTRRQESKDQPLSFAEAVLLHSHSFAADADSFPSLSLSLEAAATEKPHLTHTALISFSSPAAFRPLTPHSRATDEPQSSGSLAGLHRRTPSTSTARYTMLTGRQKIDRRQKVRAKGRQLTLSLAWRQLESVHACRCWSDGEASEYGSRLQHNNNNDSGTQNVWPRDTRAVLTSFPP